MCGVVSEMIDGCHEEYKHMDRWMVYRLHVCNSFLQGILSFIKPSIPVILNRAEININICEYTIVDNKNVNNYVIKRIIFKDFNQYKAIKLPF